MILALNVSFFPTHPTIHRCLSVSKTVRRQPIQFFKRFDAFCVFFISQTFHKILWASAFSVRLKLLPVFGYCGVVRQSCLSVSKTVRRRPIQFFKRFDAFCVFFISQTFHKILWASAFSVRLKLLPEFGYCGVVPIVEYFVKHCAPKVPEPVEGWCLSLSKANLPISQSPNLSIFQSFNLKISNNNQNKSQF